MYLMIKWLEADGQRGFGRGLVGDIADGELPQTSGERLFQDGSFGELIRVQPALDDGQSQIRE
jgi:hypothetical protein